MPKGICIKQPGAPPPTASCYICLEQSEDSNNNQPLLRNCACRGDAGWAHIACLAKFAASKVKELQQKQGQPVCSAVEFWKCCTLCKTPHQQNMAVAMAEAFVKQYEHLPDTNPIRYHSLSSLASSRCAAGDLDGALELHDRLQGMCALLTSTGVAVRDVRWQEANLSRLMAHIFLKKKQFKNALIHLERQQELWGPNSPYVQIVQNAKDKVIERIRSEEERERDRGHQKGDPAAKLMVARQKFKERREEIASSPILKLGCYRDLIKALDDNENYEEAMEQWDNLLAESRQSLGPDHPETQIYENHAATYCQQQPRFDALMVSDSSVADSLRRVCIHRRLGHALRNDGRHPEAMEQFEKSLAASRQYWGPNHPETLQNEEFAAKYQQEIEFFYLVKSYCDLITTLDKDERYQEAMEQYEKLVAESRQTLGPDHHDTQDYENEASLYRQKRLQFGISVAGTAATQKKEVWAVIDCEQKPAISGQRVKVLRATKDAKKYICVIKNDEGVSTKFKVAPNQFILGTGTMVVVHGLVSSTDLNGSNGIIRSFDIEKRRYGVSVGKKKSAVSIKPMNLNIVFS